MDLLRGAIENRSNYENMLSVLSIPPGFTTVRINTLQYSPVAAIEEMANFIKQV